MFEIDGKQYIPANPDKKLIETKSVPNILLNKGDSVNLKYSQKANFAANSEIKYEKTWICDAPARVTFQVNTYDDTSYECIHSVEYVKEI